SEVIQEKQFSGYPSSHSMVHASPEEATREDYSEMASKFLGFDPWGQSSRKGEGNVAYARSSMTPAEKNAISEDEGIRGKLKIRAASNVVSGVLGRAKIGAQFRDSKAELSYQSPRGR
ncbi:UNVERIFIED_CONTAM: hypothetical protein Sindi_0817500, partial [Sesamum indicum]